MTCSTIGGEGGGGCTVRYTSLAVRRYYSGVSNVYVFNIVLLDVLTVYRVGRRVEDIELESRG